MQPPIKYLSIRFYLSLITVFALSCGSPENLNLRSHTQTSDDDLRPQQPELPIEAPEEQPNDEVITDPLQAGLDQILESSLREELGYITQDRFNGRLSGTEGNVEIAEYIIDKLKEMNVEPAQAGEYRQTFTIRNGPTRGKRTSNIVAKFPGQDPELKDEYVVIGAHMDHAGTLSLGYTCSSGTSGSNQICNGADDNGSGTISVLNITKALAKVRKHLKRTVVVMWFSGEELGLEGSWHYVKNPIFPIEKTVYMINLDMVGYMSSYGNKLAALGGGTSNRGQDILELIEQKYPRDIQITERAGGGSDHVPFMDAGIPGVFFHTGVSNNRNYHRTSDTPDKIDFEGMLIAAKISFEQLFHVANDEQIFIANGSYGRRPPLVTPEEREQSCHHLILNPNIDKIAEDIMEGRY